MRHQLWLYLTTVSSIKDIIDPEECRAIDFIDLREQITVDVDPNTFQPIFRIFNVKFNLEDMTEIPEHHAVRLRRQINYYIDRIDYYENGAPNEFWWDMRNQIRGKHV